MRSHRLVVQGRPAGARCYWWAGLHEVDQHGLRSLVGADGVADLVQRAGRRCLVDRPDTNPSSTYLYFKLDNPAQFTSRPAYVSVRYLDEAVGPSITLEYDSATGDDLAARYRPAEDQAGGWRTGRGAWRRAVFRLERPRFAGSENLGADFRLSGGRLCVSAVSVERRRPEDWDAVARMDVSDVKPLVQIGPGGQLIIGGFDPAHASDAVPQSHALEAAVPALKSLGVTSHEGYVRWNLCEVAPGRFDWSVYDRFVEIYRKHGLKWVPFLICGSAYSLPDWYYHSAEKQGYVCLEHGQECDVQSLWNPAMKEHVRRFIRAFCEHYGKSGVIESILLGITGNYGEAIYPVTGNDWTADIHGPYHTHPGYWAGDRYAVASFQTWLARKYGGSDRLREAWGPGAPDLAHARPFLRKDAPNERAWLDFVDWYIDSMTQWARFWLHETRAHFSGDIYLCTGGHAPPEHGSDFGEQCKAAAEIHGGVRITNEGSDYRTNFSLTRWVASAGRQYGAYFSFEPAGGVDPHGVVARIYNATASGARGLHYYFPNLFGSEQARQSFVKYGGEYRQRKPLVEIGVYYPETFIRLHGNDFLGYVQPLRDRFDFDYLSDQQILDGGLKRVRALVLLHGNVSSREVWSAVTEWVRSGGLLLAPDGMGPLQTVEGDGSAQAALFGPAAARGRGRALLFHSGGRSADYRDWLARTLADAPELSEESRAMLRADGREDNVFVTLTADHHLLWLNYTSAEVSKPGVQLAPFSFTDQKLP